MRDRHVHDRATPEARAGPDTAERRSSRRRDRKGGTSFRDESDARPLDGRRSGAQIRISIRSSRARGVPARSAPLPSLRRVFSTRQQPRGAGSWGTRAAMQGRAPKQSRKRAQPSDPRLLGSRRSRQTRDTGASRGSPPRSSETRHTTQPSARIGRRATSRRSLSRRHPDALSETR